MPDSNWTQSIRTEVEERLRKFFVERRERVSELSPIACELVEAIGELTLCGGKRLRAAVLHAGCIAVQPRCGPSSTVDASAALEILQSYLLIHDDWMDQDAERRGGPSVHVQLGQRYRDSHLAASLAILAGDLASGYAWELLSNAPFPSHRRAEAYEAFARMHEEVVLGQHLDLVGHADVSRMHHLKTGSYTVRGPLRLGAMLGDASLAQLEALERFGEPVGIAFQLRDDLLGTFGDSGRTGKPTGNDLRAGKHNALIAEARRLASPEQWQQLDAVLGRSDADDAEIARAIETLEACGARVSLERRLETLLAQAHDRAQEGPFSPEGRALLVELVALLGSREH